MTETLPDVIGRTPKPGKCEHKLVYSYSDRRICFSCGKVWKKPLYNVIGDLDGVRACYGHHDAHGSPGPEDCLACPAHGSCIQLTVLREGEPA